MKSRGGALLGRASPVDKIKNRGKGGKRRVLWPLSSTPQMHTWSRPESPPEELWAGRGRGRGREEDCPSPPPAPTPQAAASNRLVPPGVAPAPPPRGDLGALYAVSPSLRFRPSAPPPPPDLLTGKK